MLNRLQLNQRNDDFFVLVGIVGISSIVGIITLIYFAAIELTLRSILIGSILF